MSTLLFHKSDTDILLKKENKDKINLFVQFFISTSKERNQELKQSLFYNVSNPNIDKIYLLNLIYDKDFVDDFDSLYCITKIQNSYTSCFFNINNFIY